MYVLTDKYGLRGGNILAIDCDINNIFTMNMTDTILFIGEPDEEAEEFFPDTETL